MKIRLAEAEFYHEDRHDEANSRRKSVKQSKAFGPVPDRRPH